MTHPTPSWTNPPQPNMTHPTPSWPTHPTWPMTPLHDPPPPHPNITHDTCSWPMTPLHDPPHPTPNMTCDTPSWTTYPYITHGHPFMMNVNWGKNSINNFICPLSWLKKISPTHTHPLKCICEFLKPYEIIFWVRVNCKMLNVNWEKIHSIILSVTGHGLRNFPLLIHIPLYPFVNFFETLRVIIFWVRVTHKKLSVKFLYMNNPPTHPYMTHPTPTPTWPIPTTTPAWPTPPLHDTPHPHPTSAWPTPPPLHDPPHPTLPPTWPTPPHPCMTHHTPHPTPTWHTPPPCMTHPTLPLHDPPPPHPCMTHPTPPHPCMIHPTSLHDPPHPTLPLHDPPHPTPGTFFGHKGAFFHGLLHYVSLSVDNKSQFDPVVGAAMMVYTDKIINPQF